MFLMLVLYVCVFLCAASCVINDDDDDDDDDDNNGRDQAECLRLPQHGNVYSWSIECSVIVWAGN